MMMMMMIMMVCYCLSKTRHLLQHLLLERWGGAPPVRHIHHQHEEVVKLPREARPDDPPAGLHLHVSLQRPHRAHREDQADSSGRVLLPRQRAAREAAAALLRPAQVLLTDMQLRDADDVAVHPGVDSAPPLVALVWSIRQQHAQGVVAEPLHIPRAEC